MNCVDAVSEGMWASRVVRVRSDGITNSVRLYLCADRELHYGWDGLQGKHNIICPKYTMFEHNFLLSLFIFFPPFFDILFHFISEHFRDDVATLSIVGGV